MFSSRAMRNLDPALPGSGTCPPALRHRAGSAAPCTRLLLARRLLQSSAATSESPPFLGRSFSTAPRTPPTRPAAASAAFQDWEDSAAASLRPPAPLPPEQPSAKQQREMRAVNTAITVNLLIFMAKVAVWTLTHSGALLAEALHSMADIGNQLLLRTGVQQSRRTPTRQHPFGFHREKYIYSLISAVGVFCLGAGAAVVHGVSSLMDPPALENMALSMGVLAASALAELWSLRVALQAIRLGAKEQGQGVMTFLVAGRDPTTAAILAEDTGAVAGLAVAGAASCLTWATGDPMYDAVGSIAVGVLMGAVAVALIRNNKRFLIGQAMQPETHTAILDHLRADPMVLAVIDPKSEELGDGVYKFKAEIQWSGDRIVHKHLDSLGRDSVYAQIRELACAPAGAPVAGPLRDAMDLALMEFGRGVIRTVAEEIDRLEEELKAMVPGLMYVDLECDRGGKTSAMECLTESAPPEDEELGAAPSAAGLTLKPPKIA